MSAPKGNLNAVKNAKRLTRLTVGELPKSLTSVKFEGRKYRSALENETLRVYGSISPTHAHHIDSAAAATVHAGICRWLLRQRLGTMTTADILTCSRELLKAKQARDASVRLLKLDSQNENVINALYSLSNAPGLLPAETIDDE